MTLRISHCRQETRYRASNLAAMKRNVILWGLAISLFVPARLSWCASPSRAAVSQIEVTEDDGGSGGSDRGGSRSWMLRADGTVQRTVEESFFDSMETGNDAPEVLSGTFQKDDFARLAERLRASGFFTLPPPPMADGEPFVSVRVLRGGHAHSVAIPVSVRPSSRADSVRWLALTLIRGITADTRWKKAGRFVDTGLRGAYSSDDAGQNALDPPDLSVLTPQGRQVAVFHRHGENLSFRLVLPPGVYRLALKNPSSAGYAWRPVPETVQIEDGAFTDAQIVLEKRPATP